MHAKRELSDCAKSLALELLQQYDDHISALFLFEHLEYGDREDFDGGQLSGLHCASFFEIAEVAAALTDLGCSDINGEDSWGFAPLGWVAQNGHGKTVKTLLEWENINPEKAGCWSETPLMLAVGHRGVVKILLRREGVNPDRPSPDGEMPLLYAVKNGHEGIVGN